MKPHSILLFFSLCISTMFARAEVASEVLPHFNSQELSLREVVHYGYTTGGLLKTVAGVKPKGKNIYLCDRNYDEQGRKTLQRMGNGVATKYTYSPTRQWLRSMHTELPSGEVLQEIRYGYDPVGNIMGIRQSADVYPLLHLGGMYENRYSYDKQYRLIEAQGRGDFPFDFKATYSTTGKLGEKHITSNTLNGDLIFGYDNKSLRHHPQLVYSPGMDITGCLWDANGNMAQVINQQRNVGRFYEWDEENRLRFVLGEKFAGYYGYDANGERVYKLTGFSSIDQVNSGYTKAQVFFDDAVLYPNPYMVVTAKGYTKHYYAGTERLATVIGRGGFGDRIVPIEELSPSEVSTIIKPFYDAYKGYDPFLHADVLQKPLTAIDITGQEFGYVAKPVIVEIVEVQAKEDILLGSIKHHAFINAEEGTVFFTHSDHLGSAAWITNENGKCIQYIHYAPFGELMDNQRVGSYDERFKFTGKERDEESGYDYFGARYYTSNLSMWLSVDPLADKYPSYSPYLYCFGRIIIMSDPNGWGDPLTVMKVRRMATSNTFGMVRHYADGRPKPHQGIDYHAAIGTEIMAVKSGTIVGCDFDGKGDYGKTITLQFSDENGNIGWAFYSHLSEIGVSINDEVKEGDIIGKTGTTGNAQGMTGEDQHLHFEYRTGGAKLGKGLTGREDPNLIVDTKFEVDPNNQNKVKLVENQTYEE